MHTGQRRGRGRQGIAIRWYLTALVLLPLVGSAGFATSEVTAQLHRSHDAQRVERVAREAERTAAARAELQEEIMPALAETFLRRPGLWVDAPASGVSLTALGVSHVSIPTLRADADRALDQLAGSTDTAPTVGHVRSLIGLARREMDDPETLVPGFTVMNSAMALLDRLESALIDRARSLGVDRQTSQRLLDVRLIADLARTQNTGVQDLATAQFAPPAGRAASFENLIADLGAVTSSAAALQREASPWVVRAAAKASDQRFALVDVDATINRYAAYRKPVPLMQLGLLWSANQDRALAMHGVLVTAITRATAAASAQAHSARTQAMIIVGLAAGMLLLCVVIVMAVRRAISKPMQQLADEANQVSQGELLAVSVRGPREVRTVGRGLAAAVDNLRKIEEQASALAGGDLESDIVRQPLPGPLGAVMHRSVSAVIDAIHERDTAQNDLAHRATHDALTELPNRTQAMEVIRRSLHRARRTGSLTGLMFIDLDHFKRVNDSLGHNAGDLVLQTCAGRMTAALRAGDTVFRLGGDEFLMLMEDVSSELDAVHLAERLIERICEPIVIGENTATVGASIGVAFSRDASVDAERLLNDADAAAYRAKQSGRGRVGIFDDDLRAALAARADVETALTHALEADELVLYYQPIVELGSDRIIGAEALMRWERPGYGLVPPNDFIPVAEASSLINDLGRWALLEATAQLARWDAQGRIGPDFTVAVNVSGRHLVSNHLLADVQEALDRSGIAPRRLTLELTETVLVDDPLGTRNLELLRERGINIAIDDFGTGYTSIGQLPRLPIDKLKIDRSFVSSTDPTHRELIPLIVAAAHAFGMTVVAEGIETPEQADALGAIGVDNGQGFYFARPQPASTPGLFEFGDRRLGNTA